MRNYIKAEFYRIIHRRDYQLTVLIFVILSIIGNLAFKFWGTKLTTNPFSAAMDLLIVTLATSPFILLAIQDIVLGDEIKNKTLNNSIANGISREKIILSKIITISIFSVLFSIIVIGVHIITAIVLFGGNGEGYRFINQYFISYLSAAPLWIGLISFYLIFTVSIQNQVVANFIIFILIFIIPKVTRLIVYFKPKLAIINCLQPYSVLKRLITLLEMGKMSTIDWFTICFGLGFFIISTIAAIGVFRKKDF